MLSIVIPTWNNLPFVKLCVESIRKNSAYQHQVVLHINDGSDGTLEWARREGLDHTYTAENAGICIAVNLAAGIASTDYIVYMNDDMYVCPNWDTHIMEAIAKAGTDNFMFSATMIEPEDHHNPCVIEQYHGKTVETFDEKGLLENYDKPILNDWAGSTWPPTIVHKKYWQITGGYSIELSPGVSSDDDFAMKMWAAGCRMFKGIGASRVYHFQSKSTLRVKKNNGRKQFLMKWGINQSTFNKYFTRRGEPYTGPAVEPSASVMKMELFRGWLKRRIV